MGLTGGIGAGKSTVAEHLARHGAVVVAADDVAREVVEPGTQGLDAVVAEFGPQVLRPDGSLDRSALGRLVFADELRRARLEEILLPLIAAEAWARLEEVEPGRVAVYDVPLLVEGQMEDMFDVVVVVEADMEARLERLAARGMEAEQAMARIASQATDAERRAVADAVIANSGSLEDLALAVDHLWDQQLAPEG
ncbi:dephospho-CoA kinase [Actinomyces slackii]|uniref:Dephospho-CoA kinase n=1 Tax=Actinomyces slackii TaxID=52774 RepID=A0A3S4U2V6_9ACTO|nr:dephospho-CoA kinase [Actinomyces slackii]VEG75133.1 Dephospho-CoA kinase [Actinomyces slackii]